MTSRLEIDETKLNELLRGPTGPVYRAVKEFADAIVDEVQQHGPLGFDQEGTREVGQLRADMRIRSESSDAFGLTITVGTDPVNPRRPYPYHYAAAVHRGRAAIDSATIMRFNAQGHGWRNTYHVAHADPRPFLYEAVAVVNVETPGPKFGLEKFD